MTDDGRPNQGRPPAGPGGPNEGPASAGQASAAWAGQDSSAGGGSGANLPSIPVREPWGRGQAWEGPGWRAAHWEDGAGQAGWARIEWRDARGWRQRGPRPRHVASFLGCLGVVLVLLLGLLTALATWVAATVLGWVSPGLAAPAPVALAVVLALALGAVGGGRTMMRSVRPLAAIATATERLADGEAGVRVEVRGPGPVRRLAASFNAMAERLDRAQRTRQALLADVTHELRTPLQVIAGSTEAMLDGVHPLDEAHLAPILAETAVMNRLLDDLRTVSLAEAGALPLHREDVDLRVLLADVAAGHRAGAAEKSVALEALSAAPDGAAARIVVDADPVRIREVVANLVVNAIRHTPAGGRVVLAARIDAPWAEVTVGDTGDGIAPDDLDQVFERFEQRRADRGGSGLGLTIARDLVLAHGGSIRAESDGVPGHGTIFRVRLPLGARATG